jgi:hypothetical protein
LSGQFRVAIDLPEIGRKVLRPYTEEERFLAARPGAHKPGAGNNRVTPLGMTVQGSYPEKRPLKVVLVAEMGRNMLRPYELAGLKSK